jgi:ribosomal protein S6--L-glutamate ligase
MKIGLLGWDYGEVDVDIPVMTQVGKDLGHEVRLFVLDEIGCVPSPMGGLQVTFGGEPAADFDVVLSRAQLRADRWQADVDLLDLASHVPGLPILDPVDVFVSAESKFCMMQRLGDAGLPVPPTRMCRSLDDVDAAWAEWGPLVIKPPRGMGGYGVKRILDDVESNAAMIAAELLEYTDLVCQPYYEAPGGDVRITVVGDRGVLNFRRVPREGGWKANYSQGAEIVPIEADQDLIDLAVRATQVMGVSISGVDLLDTTQGYRLLEVNNVPGGLFLLGEDAQRAAMTAMYDLAVSRAHEAAGASSGGQAGVADRSNMTMIRAAAAAEYP